MTHFPPKCPTPFLFPRCCEACRHILKHHNRHDEEALYSLAQALEAQGNSQQARECARELDGIAQRRRSD